MSTRRPPTPAHIPASKVFEWITSGWKLFMRAPGVWILQTLVFMATALLLGMVSLVPAFVLGAPWLGAALVLASFPVFCAGMIYSCEVLARNGTLEVGHLFAGFRQRTANLLMLGAGYLMGSGLILLIAKFIGGSTALLGWLLGPLGAVGSVIAGVLLAGVVFYVLWVVLIMALWFSPALVMLGDVAPIESLLISVRACARNLPAVVLMGAVLYAVIWLAMMPGGLGVLVAMPVIAGTVYASYCDVFAEHHARSKEAFARLLTHDESVQDDR